MLCNKSPQTYWLKIMFLPPHSSYRARERAWLGLGLYHEGSHCHILIQRLQWGKSTSSLTQNSFPVAAGLRSQFPVKLLKDVWSSWKCDCPLQAHPCWHSEAVEILWVVYDVTAYPRHHPLLVGKEEVVGPAHTRGERFAWRDLNSEASPIRCFVFRGFTKAWRGEVEPR